MAEAAPNYQQREDFWKPLPSLRPQSKPALEAVKTRCYKCQTELAAESKYCHACGVDQIGPARAFTLGKLDLASLAVFIENNLACAIAFTLGCTCLLAATSLGFLFKVATLADWQAIQFWRIEWLLGAIALYAAAIFLKTRIPRTP